MIPYIHVPSLDLGLVTIHPFGFLVAVALLVGTSLATRRAAALGLDLEKLRSFVTWMLVGGFVGGHVIDAVVYRPHEVWQRPLWLLEIWNGQGSWGGFVGALLGVLAWKHIKWAGAEPILPFADLVLSVFPVAWVFGRMGCAVAHDHPGVRAEPDALAVAYGPFDASGVARLPLGIELRNGSAPRYDLGTLELFVTILIALVLVASWRKKLPVGWYVTFIALAYPLVRFAMEFLRIEDRDPRYFYLTPAQWASLALFGFGIVSMKRARSPSRWAGVRPAFSSTASTSRLRNVSSITARAVVPSSDK